MDVGGKAAIITGGGTGVGRATALGLARRGCSVLVNYSRSREDAEKTAAELSGLGVRALAFQADVAEDSACRGMVEAALREYRLATLTLTEAASETGLKYDTIQGKVASGEIPNAGRPGSPRVRRCDLLSDEVLLARLAGS